MGVRKNKKKRVEVTPKGYAYITVSFNNIVVTMTNLSGQTVLWSSAGKLGFKGSRKRTSYVAAQVARDCAERAYQEGMREVMIRIKGLGGARETAMRALGDQGVKIIGIQDCNPQPHGGCRPPKRRST